MQISFLMPTLDEQAWIGHSVRSVRASLRACGVVGEVIVCDGGSRDETAERARESGADRVICSPRGRSRQINAGARDARGEVLVMLHADSLVRPEAVESMITAVDGGAVGGWFEIEILSERQSVAGGIALGVMAWGINLRTRLFRTATADQCIFCRREIFEQLGGLPEVSLLEGNLFARALRRSGQTAILGPQLRISGRRWQKNGLFRTMLLMYGIRAAHRAGVGTEVLAEVWHKWSR